MKKILIVNNNLDIGGIQKSLVNLLQGIHDRYDVTLMLFSRTGALLNDVPKNVKIISPGRRYRMLGLSKQELKKFPLIFVFKAFLVKFASICSRRSAMKILGWFQKKIRGYDVVISYTHFSTDKYFWNGSGDFVLDKTVSPMKICMIHCDYLNSGCMTEKNNIEYAEFDKIACCSDSVRERFIQGSKVDQDKVFTLHNFFDLNIHELASDSTYSYDNNFINVVTVARLSSEKGIARAIDALHNSKRTDIRYYLVGDGPARMELLSKITKYGMENQVFFLGAQINPFRYMKNADYLLVPSLHEAAPMVFDEAKILGLPILSTDTTSAMEMVGSEFGRVCENSTEGIEALLSDLKKNNIEKQCLNTNHRQMRQFEKIVD